MNIRKKLKYSLETAKEEKVGIIDYDIYSMSSSERNTNIIIALVVIFAVCYIFYHSYIPFLILGPFAMFYPGIRKNEKIQKRKAELVFQFKDLLYSLSSSLYTGKSLESAMKDVIRDLMIIYQDEKAYIIVEVKQIIRRLEMNEPIVDCIEDFANRAHQEDIKSFSDILKTCKKSGFDLIEVMRGTAEIINEKIEVKNEIDTMITEKKFEYRILSLMPVGLMIFLSLTTADYMQPVFETPLGKTIMTFCLGLIVLGFLLSKKVMDVKF